MMANDYLVTTISGKQVPRNKTRYINKAYHEINVDCFYISENTGKAISSDWKNQEGRWNRVDNGKIEFDHENKEYVSLDRIELKRGYVGLDSNKKLLTGFMSNNIATNVTIENTPCISYKIPEALGMVEEISSGVFYDKTYSNSISTKKGISKNYKTKINYSASDSIEKFAETYNKYYTPCNNLDCSVAKELNNLTWGIEFETDNGRVREDILYRNGLIPLKDGSLRHDNVEPFEYTTIPLGGLKGLKTVVDQVGILNKYTTISQRCALHIHIGNIVPTFELIVGFHRLILRIQNEIYSMFPTNYRFTSNNGFKQKDYCAPIKNIKLLKSDSVESNFLKIFDHYCEGTSRFKGFGVENHPQDREHRSKWNIPTRYKLVNINNLIWGSATTTEWRCHVPTLNVDKIVNWLFIISGIMQFADKNQESLANWSDLRDINLENILRSVYSKELADRLCLYIEWRKSYMSSMDPTGYRELIEDSAVIPAEMCVLPKEY